MTEPFIGQIQPFAFNFAPKNWAMCNGQVMSIVQNTALFSLIGTLYGGNGQTTFALPNLQSRVPMHAGTYIGNTYPQGETAGQEQVSLNIGNLPFHSHLFLGSTANADATTPADGQVLATATVPNKTAPELYAPDAIPQPLNRASVAPVGGNLPHDNIQPYLTINWCIAVLGIFPSRS